MLLLVLTTIKGPLDLDISNRLHLGKSLAAPKIPIDWTKLQAALTAQHRLQDQRRLEFSTSFSFASHAILLSGEVYPNRGWCHANLNRFGLKIGHLNIRSLPKHLGELKILLKNNPFHIMCLNETWLNSSGTDTELQIEGYSLVRADGPGNQRGGGTAISFRTELMGRQWLDLSSNELEELWLELRFPNNYKTLIGCSYGPPNPDLTYFKTNLEKVLETISSERARVTSGGDINVDIKRKRLALQAGSFNQLFNLYQ